MHFHFQLANHYFGGLYLIEDIVAPIAWGLRALGHRVTMGVLPDLPSWPSVVLLLEYFNRDGAVDETLNWRNSEGRKCLGLICTEDIDDKLVMENPEHPGRRRNLLRILPHCDFVWPLVPCDYGAYVAADRLSFLDLGYVEALHRDPAPPGGGRDLDVLLYASMNERRQRVVDALRARGLAVAASRGLLPDYMRDNLIGRSRVVLDVKRGDAVKYTSPSRICTALQMGATLVSERFDTTRLGELYRFTQACDFDEVVDRCAELARAPDCLAFGQEARERFRRERPMTDNLRRAMDLPVFRELAAGDAR